VNQRGAGRGALGVGAQARIRQTVLPPDGVAERRPLRVGDDGEGHLLAVGGLEDVVDAPRRQAHRHRRQRPSRDTQRRHVLRDQEGAVLEQRRAYQLAAAGLVPLQQRGEDADRREHAAHDVVDGASGAQGSPRRASHVGKTVHHLDDLVARHAILIGAVEEALVRSVDEPRVALAQLRPAETELLHRAGAR